MSNVEELQVLEEPQQTVAEEHQEEVFIVQPPSSILEAETEVVVIPIDQGIRVIIPESTGS
ncbi:MAG: hypothetical protein ACYS80_20500 [Planctomycetota bacterium]|jgi:hypothetical protein